MGYEQYPNLIDKSYIPLKAMTQTSRESSNESTGQDKSCMTNGYLDTVIDWIPGMKGIRLKDLPSFLRTTDLSDFMIDFVCGEAERARRGSAIIFNTFEKLEHNVLEVLSSMFPPIYTIGPLHLLTNQINDDSLKLIGSNLWKEEPQCLEWLDTKGPNSVVYVNFGSITVMTPNQMVEFAWGLANSNQTFLWVIRPDLVTGDLAVLPPEFMEATKERGLLASWCPQEQVLDHPSIGGFLTHSGWNSTLESISSGVPMVCWPFFAEQQTNCWHCCTQWGIAMEIDNDVKKDEVESLVRELMVGEKGKEMKKKAVEWKRLAQETTESSSGSSFLNLDKLVNQVLLSLRH
ncbi:7-deoxyloganetin glucosyltransferase-like [Camellia sinensis]|uniref:7-deoxyloganetin glucosyltransferase-like n=1 Tax=Camellia sinensis TaxID=4442 RepID=UPI0010359514|nr:7-deoxyloganetin glucosyltransferase-like [Camellia sinensis]